MDSNSEAKSNSIYYPVLLHDLLRQWNSNMSCFRKHEETWKLLQPELMTQEQLLAILKEVYTIVILY